MCFVCLKGKQVEQAHIPDFCLLLPLALAICISLLCAVLGPHDSCNRAIDFVLAGGALDVAAVHAALGPLEAHQHALPQSLMPLLPSAIPCPECWPPITEFHYCTAGANCNTITL